MIQKSTATETANLRRAMKFVRHSKHLSTCLSILGMALVCYVLGAGAMFYQLPSSGWLANAFAGARVWSESKRTASPPLPPAEKRVARPAVDRPDKTYDGFTLYTCPAGGESGTQATLINMQREVVHRWAIPFSHVWPNPVHIDTRPNDSWVWFFDTYLYPNGDLLAVFHAMNRTGCGLAKLDKESNLLWAYPAGVHHAVDVAEDGTIYTLQHEEVDELPQGLEKISTPCLVEYLVALSPDGKPLRKPLSILAALRNSPYAAVLSMLEKPTKRRIPRPGSTAPHVNYAYDDSDVLHANCVRVLSRDLVSKFPNFKAGHVLVSMRTLSLIAMLDPETGVVDWAARGPWQAQHDPQFLENGHLLIFDNLGSPIASRVLEYDPQTQAVPWSYAGEGDNGAEFFTSERGMSQRLPNGNTFIVSSESGELIEITGEKEVVWYCTLDGNITTARRFGADQLPFLGADRRPR